MKFCALSGIVSLALLLIGCGGGSGNNGPVGPDTTINVNFSGATPTAVATQAGNGAFTSATPAGQITFVVPGGTQKYAVAFVCPFSNGSTLNTEFVFEGSIMDTTSPTVNCFSQPPASGTATGNVASSSLGNPGLCCTDFFLVEGSQNFGIVIGEVSHPSLSFSTPMPVGPNDIAVLQFEQATDIVHINGIKIIRAQMVPGMIGGSGINLVADDAVVTHLVTAANIPPGFSGDHASIFYNTPNGTTFSVKTEPDFTLTLYAAVPAASTQPGDFYTYEQTFSNLSNPSLTQRMGVDMTTTSGGGDVTFSAPAPWAFTGPTSARLPAFTYSYSGFAGLPTTLFTASIRWQLDSTTQDELTVMATPNALSSGSTLTIPDLSSIPGSFVPAASGAQIFWTADIFGGTVEPIRPRILPNFFPSPPPPNSSGMFVENSGSYTQP